MADTNRTHPLLDSSNSTPLYRQLANIIRDGIEKGEYAHDTQIPTESDLIQKYSVSRITVRKALEELTDEGLLTRKQGKGTFVSTSKSIQSHYPFMPFDDAVQQAGKVPSTRLLSYSLEVPSRRISTFLGIPENDSVIIIKRIRFADDVPIILETDYFLSSFDFLSSEPLNGSTSAILTRHNILPLHGVNAVSICYATEEESALLHVEPDSPLLYVYSEIKDQNMKPTQVSKQIILSSSYKLIMTS